MPNRLSLETSPYLRQHAENPVDWYPWGDEAFEKARREDKPIFLSVGYSACHWCHVMEHESFENEATAALMNEHFVSVKVDREERPDIDSIYMDAVQALTGRGGWPMSVFLTPDGVPFYGGTYFPGAARHGLPGFLDVLGGVADLWASDRSRLLQAAAELSVVLTRRAEADVDAPLGYLDSQTLETAMRGLHRSFDRMNGGWGEAPKFPQPAVLEFVLRRHHATGDERLLEMVTLTLDAMLRGGVYDQLGGGFHRYSTDERWLVPHFEKMLYDNAQLAALYLHAWQVTRHDRYQTVAAETLDYVAREMLDPAGGFYSAQDADSEGEEGRFFVWTPDQLRAVLEASSPDPDADAEMFMRTYGVTRDGNFEGRNILFVKRTPAEVAEDLGAALVDVEVGVRRARQALFAARDRRVRPGLDDKVLAAWNGLMLAAFAEAARVFGRDDYLAIAKRNAQFLLSQMRRPDGRMLRTWKGDRAKLNGYLEDYAAVAGGMLQLYETTFDPRWLQAGRELVDSILEHFADPPGGFFDTSDDHEALLLRPKGVQDGALPSGGAMTADALVRLAEYTGDSSYTEYADVAVAKVQGSMAWAPLGFARWLSVLDMMLAPPEALAIVGPDPEAMLDVVRQRYRPNVVVAAARADEPSGGIALLEHRETVDGRTTAYLCRQFICNRPVTEADDLSALLRDRPTDGLLRAEADAPSS